MTRRRPLRAQRGQTLVLTALSMLIIALMTMVTFNLSRALHRRMALQQQADAAAFSTAVVEARTLNYLAYSNRAQAASLVSMMILHAHMVAATAAPEVFQAGYEAFEKISIAEGVLCALSLIPGNGGMAVHCGHVAPTLAIAYQFRAERNKWRPKVKNLEPKFRAAMDKIDKMMDHNYRNQRLIVTQTTVHLQGAGIAQLRAANAPLATVTPVPVRVLNGEDFSCALDGAELPCDRDGIPRNRRAMVLTEVANASRTTWAAARSPKLHFHPVLMERLIGGVQSYQGASELREAKGTAKLINAINPGRLHNATDYEGTVIGSDEHIRVWSKWTCLITFGFGDAAADLYTSTTGPGRHRPTSAHAGGNHRWEGTNANEPGRCLSNGGNCFIRFRATDERQDNFGQVRAYAVASQNLRLDRHGQRAVWEVNNDATVSFASGGNTGTLRLASGRGVAASKAMAYYHRIGDWQEQPNMFNPFWRAKLHPFTPDEAKKVLTAAGEADAAQMSLALPVY
jgi:hypothetical protein